MLLQCNVTMNQEKEYLRSSGGGGEGSCLQSNYDIVSQKRKQRFGDDVSVSQTETDSTWDVMDNTCCAVCFLFCVPYSTARTPSLFVR
jgi:hypothetical protein